MPHRPPYDPDFDDEMGFTESPDLVRAQAAAAAARAAVPDTESAIAESQRYITQIRKIRDEDHFTQKIRQIMTQGVAYNAGR